MPVLCSLAIFPHVNWLPTFSFGLLSVHVKIVINSSYIATGDVIWVPEI